MPNSTMFNDNDIFKLMYAQQGNFQQHIIDSGLYDYFLEKPRNETKLPDDNVRLFSFHIQQLMSEIGEILSSDKRWKSHRNETNKEMLEHKKEEIADCFIVLMNICLFSGLTAEEVAKSIITKQSENYTRLGFNK